MHLEVWQDYGANRLNPAARQWIDRGKTHQGSEPWVFVVDRVGLIVDRLENVASDADLREAITRVGS